MCAFQARLSCSCTAIQTAAFLPGALLLLPSALFELRQLIFSGSAFVALLSQGFFKLVCRVDTLDLQAESLALLLIQTFNAFIQPFKAVNFKLQHCATP